jgi:outer membrane scaffolding protein for murein synthesis (MipA/OmpV family)
VWGFEFDPRWDVSDDIGGLFTLRSHYTAPFGGPWRFRGGVETTYASEDYMDEYFSINVATRQRAASTPSMRTTASRTSA